MEVETHTTTTRDLASVDEVDLATAHLGDFRRLTPTVKVPREPRPVHTARGDTARILT